jgi:thioredoxin reductase
MASDPRPFPPGGYPAIIVGSGPGGLQLSYGLRRRGVAHAVLSADPAPGGMFRKWPFFQRLLSWTKPYAPEERTSRAYQRFDWNSLIADEPELRSLQAEFLDGTSYFPSRMEMEANLTAFADRAHIDVRYGCTWQRTRREDGPDGTTFVLETTDGEYRTGILVVAVGVARPGSSTPATTRTRARSRSTRVSVCSSSASRTRGSSWRPGSQPGHRRSS